MRNNQTICQFDIYDQWTTSNTMITTYWPRETENNSRFSLVTRTKSNHQLENRRILLADICSQHKEDPSFIRTTMEKRKGSEGIKGNFYRRNKKLTTSFKTKKKRDEQ